MSVSEELVKLLLDELRKNNEKIDKNSEKVDNIINKVSNIESNVTTIMIRTSELDIHLKEAKEDIRETKDDIEKIDHTIKGNGSPGLKTKVELLENDQKNIKKDMDSFKKVVNESKIEEKKQSTAVKLAIISGAGSGFVALMLEIINNIWK